jgi:hypothetical protein
LEASEAELRAQAQADSKKIQELEDKYAQANEGFEKVMNSWQTIS